MENSYKKKRFTIIDHKKGRVSEISSVSWNIAWFLVFMMGFILGGIII